MIEKIFDSHTLKHNNSTGENGDHIITTNEATKNIIIVDLDDERHEISGPIKLNQRLTTIRDIIMTDSNLDDQLECSCGGSCACSTCQVTIDDESFKLLPPASEDEQDLLDLAYQVKHNSRLGCQVNLCDLPQGAIVTIKPSRNICHALGRNPAMNKEKKDMHNPESH